MSTYTVDSAGIDRRIFTLPREVCNCKDGGNASAEEQTPLGNKQGGNCRSHSSRVLIAHGEGLNLTLLEIR
ncbi:MAG: hypothetical protein R3E32_28055 [Chitinophagales bacterium]